MDWNRVHAVAPFFVESAFICAYPEAVTIGELNFHSARQFILLGSSRISPSYMGSLLGSLQPPRVSLRFCAPSSDGMDFFPGKQGLTIEIVDKGFYYQSRGMMDRADFDDSFSPNRPCQFGRAFYLFWFFMSAGAGRRPPPIDKHCQRVSALGSYVISSRRAKLELSSTLSSPGQLNQPLSPSTSTSDSSCWIHRSITTSASITVVRKPRSAVSFIAMVCVKTSRSKSELST